MTGCGINGVLRAGPKTNLLFAGPESWASALFRLSEHGSERRQQNTEE